MTVEKQRTQVNRIDICTLLLLDCSCLVWTRVQLISVNNQGRNKARGVLKVKVHRRGHSKVTEEVQCIQNQQTIQTLL